MCSNLNNITMLEKINRIFLILLMSVSTMSTLASDDNTVVTYLTEEPKNIPDHPDGQRKPGKPIRCLITPTGVTLTPAIDDSEILSFDIYVDDMPVASFDDEADFCAFIFSYTGTAEIRLHTTEHTLAGFITL